MNDERWKSLLSFGQFVLGTVIIGTFGTIINHQIQTREVEIKEQEQIGKNLPHVLSANSADKLLMAQFYSSVTRSDEIRKRWMEYREELKKEIAAAKAEAEKAAAEIQATTDAIVIDQKQAVIQRVEANTTPGAKPVDAQALPARIYFHIQNEGQRPGAAKAAAAVSKDGVTVPGIQLVGAAPRVTELRYFKLEEAPEAEKLAGALKRNGIDAAPKYVAGFESSRRLRPRHYELWMAASSS